MRIGLLSAWASRLGGGVFEAVIAQAEGIVAQGGEPILFALEDRHSPADRHRFPGTVHTFRTSGPRMVGYAGGLLPKLIGADLDLLHLHGIWMYPSMAGAGWARRTDRPYVISPHGMLDPWIVSRGRLKKAVARIGYERSSWRRAAVFHALTAAEAADIAKQTGRGAAIIPNAVRHDPAPADSKQPYILSLGRIHPKKNLSGLVEGWHRAQAGQSGWELVIAGWGEADHVAAFEAQLSSLADPSIRFVGPAYGEAKSALLGGARFLILPSFSEGLPLTILEAWAAGTPTIHSEGCNLSEGFASGAALQTGTDATEIGAAISRAIAMQDGPYKAMADAAAALAVERFSPDAVGAQWASLYADAAA